MARGAVLECRGARSVRGDGSACERAFKCRRRRVIQAAIPKPPLKLRERNASAYASGSVTWLANLGEPPRAEHDIAARRGAARQRRLGADRQDACARCDDRRDFVCVSGKYNASRDAPRHVCGIAEERLDKVVVVLDGRHARGRRTACRGAVSQGA